MNLCSLLHAVRPRRSSAAERTDGTWMTAATLLAALLAAATLLTGCADPRGIAPHARLLNASEAGATAQEAPWPADAGWASFGDPQLQALVDQALAGQPGLQAVEARIAQAQAAVELAGAARRPQVTGSADATRQHLSANGIYPPPLGGATLWNNNAQLGAGWELDLFGRRRAALEAAIGQQRAAEAERQAARVLLAGNVATAYVNLARLLESRAIAEQSLQQRRDVDALVAQRIGAGLDTNVEARQAEGVIAQTQVDVEAIDEAVARTRHALAELTGQGPDALAALSPTLAAVPALALPAGLPADLIGRRADLVAQRWRVEAARRGVDEARAAFYPNVDLTAFVGLNSIGFENFVKGASRSWGVGPAIHLPVFDAGRLRAGLGAQAAAVDGAVADYNAALLRALREVADEIGTLQSLARQQDAQDRATRAAESAYDLALQRYRAGLGTYLVVLTADGNVLGQRRAAAELKARRLNAQLALSRALGGGYDGRADLPESVAAR